VCVCVIVKFVWTTRDDWRLRFAIRWHLSWWRWWWGVVVQPPPLVDILHTEHTTLYTERRRRTKGVLLYIESFILPPPEISIPLR
jgi:hypothetical protein